MTFVKPLGSLRKRSVPSLPVDPTLHTPLAGTHCVRSMVAMSSTVASPLMSTTVRPVVSAEVSRFKEGGASTVKDQEPRGLPLGPGRGALATAFTSCIKGDWGVMMERNEAR